MYGPSCENLWSCFDAVCVSGATTCNLWSTYTGELLASVPLSTTAQVLCRHVTQAPPPGSDIAVNSSNVTVNSSDVTVNSMSFVMRLGLEDPFPALIVGHPDGALIVS